MLKAKLRFQSHDPQIKRIKSDSSKFPGGGGGGYVPPHSARKGGILLPPPPFVGKENINIFHILQTFHLK